MLRGFDLINPTDQSYLIDIQFSSIQFIYLSKKDISPCFFCVFSNLLIFSRPGGLYFVIHGFTDIMGTRINF